MNVYITPAGRPMIYSMESARQFLQRTIEPLYIPQGTGYFSISRERVSYMEKIDEWADLEVWRFTEEEAVHTVYRLRKYINARFRRNDS